METKRVSKKPLIVWFVLFLVGLILAATAFSLTFLADIGIKVYKQDALLLPLFAQADSKTLFSAINGIGGIFPSALENMFNFKAIGENIASVAITTWIGYVILALTLIVVIVEIIVFCKKRKPVMILWVLPTLIVSAFLLEMTLITETFIGTVPSHFAETAKMLQFKGYLTFSKDVLTQKFLIGYSVTLYLFIAFVLMAVITGIGTIVAPMVYASKCYVEPSFAEETEPTVSDASEITMDPYAQDMEDDLQPNEFEENVNNLNTIGTTSPLVVQYINSYGEPAQPAKQAETTVPADYVTKQDFKELLTEVFAELKARDEEKAVVAEPVEEPVVAEPTPVVELPEPEPVVEEEAIVAEPEAEETDYKAEDVFANLVDDEGNQVEVIDVDDLKQFIHSAVAETLEAKAREEERKEAEIKEAEKTINEPVETVGYDEEEDTVEVPVTKEEPIIAPDKFANHPIVVAVPADYTDEEVAEEPVDSVESIEEVREIVADEIREAFKGLTLPTKQEKVIVKKVVVQKPVEQPAPVAEPEPVVEEPAPVEEPKPAPQPKPVVRPVVRNDVRGSESVIEKGEVIQLNFLEKVASGSKDLIRNYNEVKNLLMSFGLKDRLSNSADTFRLHKNTYAKITTNGDAMKLFLALDPKDFMSTALPIQDMSHKAAYKEIPLAIKIKSEVSLRRAIELIYACMRKNDLVQDENADMTVDYVKLVRKELKKIENSKR